jgi:hypothetical protein
MPLHKELSMNNQIFFYLGAIFTTLWGITHLFPTKNIVKDFGDISEDNRNIITMEWIVEGVALIFIGGLVAIVTMVDPTSVVSVAVYRWSALGLVVLAIVSLFTGFKVNFFPFKLCPLIFGVSAILILAIFAVATTAFACSCGGLPKTKDDAELWIERRDLVALVLVEEYSNRGWVENKLKKHDSYVRGSIVKSFKGLPENFEVYIDLNSESTCAAHFQLQNTYLVFASGPDPNGRFETSMCSMGQYWADSDEPGFEEHNKLLQRIITPTIDAIEDALE